MNTSAPEKKARYGRAGGTRPCQIEIPDHTGHKKHVQVFHTADEEGGEVGMAHDATCVLRGAFADVSSVSFEQAHHDAA
jgi:hypothetical protein